MIKSNTNIAAVVVTYNRLEYLKKCVDGIRKQIFPVNKIIIVNNGNDIDMISWLNAQEDLHIINQMNSGSAGGQYTGIRFAYEAGYEWIWCMDDDVVPQDDCLEVLLNSSEGSVRVPLRIDTQGNIDDYTAIVLDLHTLFLRDFRRKTIQSEYSCKNDVPKSLEVHEFTFEGPLINRIIIAQCGFPRRDFFISGEDTEFALRIRYHHKYQIHLCSDALLMRLNPVKHTSYEGYRYYYLIRNLCYCYLVYGENIFVKIHYFVFLLLSIAKNLMLFKPNKKKITMQLMSMYDVIFHRYDFPKRFIELDSLKQK